MMFDYKKDLLIRKYFFKLHLKNFYYLKIKHYLILINFYILIFLIQYFILLLYNVILRIINRLGNVLLTDNSLITK